MFIQTQAHARTHSQHNTTQHNTHFHKCTHAHTCTDAHTHSLTHSLTHTLTHTHTRTHSLTHSLTHSRASLTKKPPAQSISCTGTPGCSKCEADCPLGQFRNHCGGAANGYGIGQCEACTNKPPGDEVKGMYYRYTSQVTLTLTPTPTPTITLT